MNSEVMACGPAAREHISDLTVRILSSLDEVADLAPVWRDMATEINADPDFFTTVVQSRPEVLRPHVLTLEREGKLVAILVARLEATRVKAKFGYLKVVNAKARALTVVYGGVLGEASPAVCQTMLKSLRQSLEAGEAELLKFAPLPLDHPFHAVLEKDARDLPASRGEEPILHWRLTLPESTDALLKMRSSKTRSNIRKYRKRLETDFRDNMALKIYSEPGDLETVVADMLKTTQKSYKQGLGVGFRDTRWWRAILALGFRKSWLHIYMLYLAGQPAAYCAGYVYKRKFLRFNSAYAHEFFNYRIGNYMMLVIFDRLCNNPDIDVFDYGFGDAEYKRDFATENWQEAEITLYAPSLRGRALWGAVRLTTATSAQARGLVRHAKLEQRLKTLTRQFLRRREQR